MNPAVLAVLDRVMEVHEATMGDAQILEPESGLLEMVAWRGIPDETVIGTPESPGWRWVDPRTDTTICCRAFRSGRPLFISDVINDPPYKPYLAATLASGMRAAHCIPILVDGRCVAMISPIYAAPRSLPPRALERSRRIRAEAGDWIPASALALPSRLRSTAGVAVAVGK